MNQYEFNKMINADIQRMMIPKLHSYMVTVLSRLNHYDDIQIMATDEDDAIDRVIENTAYDIKKLFCNDLEVSV